MDRRPAPAERTTLINEPNPNAADLGYGLLDLDLGRAWVDGLLMVGALFVWFRGTSGTEDVLDDDLEREEDPILVS